MRAIIQRVTSSSVKVDGKVCGNIGKGLMVLVGFVSDDTPEDLEWMCGKIINMRIFDDENGVMNLSVKDINGEILVISQFTLMASTKKGNRPSYIKAAPPEISIPLYESFKERVEINFGKKIECGIFGAEMEVSLVNDGPVTISIDTKNKE